ncbi:MAG: hypothetical protein AAGH64_08890 [Planctomycetota bacterium]
MTATAENRPTTPLTRPLGLAGGVLVTLGGLAGAGSGVLAATGGVWSRPDAFVVFFGVCSLIAGALGALVALGRFRDTVGMTLLIGVGTLVVGGALSEPQLVAGVLGQAGGEFRSYHGVMLKHLMFAQLGAAGLGALLCAAEVWSRNPKASVPLVVRFLVASAVLAGIGVCIVVPGARNAITGLPMFVTAFAVIMGGVLTILCAAVGGHTLIRSFEVANEPAEA